MELSEKDIETLREAVDGCGGPSYTQAIAILDRLSPAPEVDDVTVWTRKVLATWTLGDLKVKIACGDKDENEDFMNVRAVIAELIASKDAEIAKLTGERDRQYDDNANRIAAEGAAIVRAEKAESERAALRAENERLRDAFIKLLDATDRFNGICAHNKQPMARMQGNMILAVRNAYEVLGIGRTKAAERNTAEPEKPCTCHPDDNPPRPCPKKYALDECRAAATDTTPEVVVTQADISAAKESIFYECGNRHVKADIQMSFARHRTEAEARGRREALEEAGRYFSAFTVSQPTWNFVIDKLQRMMTEPKP